MNFTIFVALISFCKKNLALEEGGEEADNKAHREGVINQLLVLLNTAVSEQKQMSKEFEDIGDLGGGLAQDLADIGHDERERRRRPVEKADSIEYEHGSLGIVPRSADDL